MLKPNQQMLYWSGDVWLSAVFLSYAGTYGDRCYIHVFGRLRNVYLGTLRRAA